MLAIGDEVIRGEIVNGNAASLGLLLFDLGFGPIEHAAVSDEPLEIAAALRRLAATCKVVVVTGGLGPTDDDRTVDVVAELLGTPVDVHGPSAEAMQRRFAALGYEMTPNNLRQVRAPRGARVFDNGAGIAPGFEVAQGGATLFFLPGVPVEVARLVDDHVRARLVELAAGPAPASRIVRVLGMGESHVDHRLADLGAVADGIAIHYRTAPPENLVRFVVRDADPARAAARLDAVVAAARERLGDVVYGLDDETFAAALGRVLRERGATLALAESCTGGLAGEIVTRQAGSSAWFRGGVVAYDNAVKVASLGVSEAILAQHGAVSEAVAAEMARGAAERLGATVAAATTGIAGPDGGTASKPVGTVCFAVHGLGRPTTAVTRRFPGDRARVRLFASHFALDLVRRRCLGLPEAW